MGLDPLALVTGATIAVILMVTFIRLMTGSRQARIDEATVRDFLAHEEINVPVLDILLSEDHRAALVRLDDPAPIRLIRSFGNTLVMQVLSNGEIQPQPNRIVIARQDMGHPATTLSLREGQPLPGWLSPILKGQTT
ncbi:hypothetical protein [Sneathiella chinensis]|uniref:Uncharacterized protein n=1 Tax=Sneathiella chinensis TaxID=349750 RepID=A0ABQ5U7F4_9PROT|nr:hypothetical protein [Sneathiella chinensis]GLQ06386.1 hypothetical protein GCM10007924_16070 [Sneathiella chinensis]